MFNDDNKKNLSLDDDTDSSGKIQLVSNEKNKKKFDVDRKFASISKLVRTTLDNDSTATTIELPSVDGNSLALVVEYMNHHQGVEQPKVEKPLKSKILKELVKDPWDAEFMARIWDTNRQSLYDLILAANYLDIEPLLHLGCAKVACTIKGQPLNKLKELLSVERKNE